MLIWALIARMIAERRGGVTSEPFSILIDEEDVTGCRRIRDWRRRIARLALTRWTRCDKVRERTTVDIAIQDSRPALKCHTGISDAEVKEDGVAVDCMSEDNML